jgi:hypothetical protein
MVRIRQEPFPGLEVAKSALFMVPRDRMCEKST